jgi:hypothetical protein
LDDDILSGRNGLGRQHNSCHLRCSSVPLGFEDGRGQQSI